MKHLKTVPYTISPKQMKCLGINIKYVRDLFTKPLKQKSADERNQRPN